MGLAKIKYKSFTFPINPETTSMKCDRSYIKHKYPELAGNELEDFGVNACIISGTGVFIGSNAYKNAKKLYDEYKKNGGIIDDWMADVVNENRIDAYDI